MMLYVNSKNHLFFYGTPDDAIKSGWHQVDNQGYSSATQTLFERAENTAGRYRRMYDIEMWTLKANEPFLFLESTEHTSDPKTGALSTFWKILYKDKVGYVRYQPSFKQWAPEKDAAL